MLIVIYTLLLGLLCAGFIECAIYAFFPSPQRPSFVDHAAASDSPVEALRQEKENQLYSELAEKHSIKHYVMSLLGSSLQAVIALQFHSMLGVLSDGVLLGAVFTLGTGTVFGITGGGRTAKFAVVTASLVVALGLGWLEFLPHRI
jgi:hypothetical protein